MPRKKILFVIVEGPSDDAALSVLLSRFFDSNVVHVHVMHCDITTELGVTPNNIVRTIGDCVKKFAGRLYKSGDFCQIIHHLIENLLSSFCHIPLLVNTGSDPY